MPKRKRADEDQAAQSKRFVEAAKEAEVDESGKAFDRAIKKVLPAKGRQRAKNRISD